MEAEGAGGGELAGLASLGSASASFGWGGGWANLETRRRNRQLGTARQHLSIRVAVLMLFIVWRTGVKRAEVGAEEADSHAFRVKRDIATLQFRENEEDDERFIESLNMTPKEMSLDRGDIDTIDRAGLVQRRQPVPLIGCRCQ